MSNNNDENTEDSEGQRSISISESGDADEEDEGVTGGDDIEEGAMVAEQPPFNGAAFSISDLFQSG